MKFLYYLNTQTEHKWTMLDLWRLYNAVKGHSSACAGHESRQFCWGSLRDAATAIGDDDQARIFRDQAFAHGIDENLNVGGAP